MAQPVKKTEKFTPASPGARQVSPSSPLLGQQGTRFLGRLVIEMWEPSDPSSDGLTYSVDGTAGRAQRDADAFALKAAQALVARLQRQGTR
jgi:hypothetical protein